MSDSILEEDYEVSGLVGSGSVGLIYRATNRKTGQQVAIKEFARKEGGFKAFLQELSFLFTQDHPNLVKVENMVYGDSKKSYLIMEYAAGGSLRDFLNQHGSLSSEVALAAVTQILEGLAELHNQGVVHCDIKPENVLLFPLVEDKLPDNLLDYRLKLTDLGIGLHLTSSEHKKRAGSPVYMAPEQFYDQVSPSSDLYSVGVLLFELCTGRFPFEGDATQLFSQHLQEKADLSLLEDESLREFCELLLRKDPFERPTDATKALLALNSVFGQPLELVPDGMEDWFPLDSFPQNESELELSLPFPGAQSCFALPNGHFLISHSNGTDILDPTRHRLIPNLLQEPVLAVTAPRPDGIVYVATPSWVGQIDRELAWKPLFRPLTKILALAYQDVGNRLIYADEQSVTSCNLFGDLDLRIPLRNYFLAPSIATTENGYLASCGPTNPRLLGVEKVGDLDSVEIELPGPVLTCSRIGGVVHAIIFPNDASEQAGLCLIDPETHEVEYKALQPGIHSARYQSGLLLLIYSEKVIVANHDCSIQVEHKVGKAVQDACWNFKSQRLLVVTRGSRSTEVMLRRLKDVESKRLSA